MTTNFRVAAHSVYSSVWILAVAFPSLVFLSGSSCSLSAEEPSQNHQLIEALDAAVAASSPGIAFELIGRNTKTTEFDDAIVESEITDFRYQMDQKSEFLRWAFKRKTEDLSSENSLGNVLYFSAEVDGNTSTHLGGPGITEGKKVYQSFEEAIAQTQRPKPQFFGVMSFRFLGNPENLYDRFKLRMMDAATNVRVEESARSVEYRARYEESPSRFSVYRWQFSLPDYLPREYTVDQARNGDLNRIWTQRIFSEPTDGRLRPFHIFAETIAVRENDGEYEIGRRMYDAEFIWRKFDKSEESRIPLADIEDIQDFIDEGKQIVEHVDFE